MLENFLFALGLFGAIVIVVEVICVVIGLAEALHWRNR